MFDFYISSLGAIAMTSFYFDYSLPHTMFQTNCSGDETRLLDCSYITQLNGSNCSASENAGVICQGIYIVRNTKVIL